MGNRFNMASLFKIGDKKDENKIFNSVVFPAYFF